MNIFFLIVVIFLIALAICNLVVGVSNDAVNFLNSAIGAKVARQRTIVIVASIGVFLGASLSNGMMDVARNGIMTPAYCSFYDVMCVFLAVMMTNVVLLDVFNSRGLPTSTTVSMVFALLGGAFSIALLHISKGATAPDGSLLTIGDLVNTEKAISVILGIFCSVAIAFVIGAIVQWVARIVFTFTYDKRERNGKEITAGVAFIACFGVTIIMNFGGFWVMGAAIALTIVVFVRNSTNTQHTQEHTASDELFQKMMQSQDKEECWELLKEHVGETTRTCVTLIRKRYELVTTAFFCEDYRSLKQVTAKIEEMHKEIKRQRRKQIVGLRNIDPIVSVEKGTWYFLTNSTLTEMVYSLKRMGEPCRDHVSNNFQPVEPTFAHDFLSYRDEVLRLFDRTLEQETNEQIREDILRMQASLSTYRKKIIHDIETQQLNIEAMTVLLNMVQETQLLIGSLRQLAKGMMNFGTSLSH